jgi:hypothetical protein
MRSDFSAAQMRFARSAALSHVVPVTEAVTWPSSGMGCFAHRARPAFAARSRRCFLVSAAADALPPARARFVRCAGVAAAALAFPR